MANNSFSVRFDFDGAVKLADRIDSLSLSAFVRFSAVDAANAVAARFDVKARRAMNLGLNLSDSYIEQRVKLIRAAAPASGPVRAEIVTRGDLTILGHYPHQQLRQPGTQLRKGPSRGRRPSGVAVEIRKGQAAIEPQWFTMRLRAGTVAGDKVGVFVRTSENKTKHIYGPSPYSLFRYQINDQADELAADLEQTAVDFAAKAIRKGLS
jgi:hypothetical protein